MNELRKDAGLELTDRIELTLPQSEADLLEEHGAWIKDEVLAVSVETDSVDTPRIVKS